MYLLPELNILYLMLSKTSSTLHNNPSKTRQDFKIKTGYAVKTRLEVLNDEFYLLSFMKPCSASRRHNKQMTPIEIILLIVTFGVLFMRGIRK